MTSYVGRPDFQHGTPKSIGVLIANLGTPDAPDAPSLRRYLRQFLSDPRVVEFPRVLWWLILNLVILNVRPKKSAKAYGTVWTSEGSPLLVHSKNQEKALAEHLCARLQAPLQLKLGMRYGSPSIASALEEFSRSDVSHVFVLPLYPQYSGSTTASTFDAVFDFMKTQRWVPDLRTCTSYYDHPGYIKALADSIQSYRQQHGTGDRLLFSFHGIPQRYFLAGDPYHCHCHATAARVADELQLTKDEWSVSFQSRFGREQWLSPYTDEVLRAMPPEGVGRIDIVCPGFASDCIETLEEIEEENRGYFMQAGGESFNYIPCLNDSDAHISALSDLIFENIADWDKSLAAVTDDERNQSRERASAMGASA